MSVGHDPFLRLSHQPGILLIHLLNRCNLLCQHCYLDATPERNTSLPLELVIRCLEEAEPLGVATIYISGGEPFLYPSLPEVLSCASRKPNLEVYISTNGTLIGAAEASLVRDNAAKVQVSIDGPEEYHDEVRGLKGAFRLSGSGIQHLVAAGVPTGVVTTICQDNMAFLPWLAWWAAGMGVEHLTVQPLLQLGRGANIRNKKLSEEHLCDLFLQLSDLGHAYQSQGLRFSLGYRSHRLLLEHPCAAYVCNGNSCHRRVAKEIKRVVIREDGTVLPEIPNLDYRFALGNLRDDPLTEMVPRYFANGYEKFDRLCRTTYEEVMPTWESPIIPWNEIVSERSRSFIFEKKYPD